MSLWIDAHCHLADARLTQSLDAIIERSKAAGITTWIQGGVCPEDWNRQKRLHARYGAGFVPVFGLHPWWVSKASESSLFEALTALETALPDARALGELGLDYGPKVPPSPQSVRLQGVGFERQIELAHAHRLPMVLHVVRAHADALTLLKNKGPFPNGGIIHSFSASFEIAKAYLDLGFHLSVGGAATREGFQNLKKTLVSVPHDRLVIETDSPDQLPVLPGLKDHSLNEPANLIGIARRVAEIRNEPVEDVLLRSAENLRRIFRIKP